MMPLNSLFKNGKSQGGGGGGERLPRGKKSSKWPSRGWSDQMDTMMGWNNLM